MNKQTKNHPLFVSDVYITTTTEYVCIHVCMYTYDVVMQTTLPLMHEHQPNWSASGKHTACNQCCFNAGTAFQVMNTTLTFIDKLHNLHNHTPSPTVGPTSNQFLMNLLQALLVNTICSANAGLMLTQCHSGHNKHIPSKQIS